MNIAPLANGREDTRAASTAASPVSGAVEHDVIDERAKRHLVRRQPRDDAIVVRFARLAEPEPRVRVGAGERRAPDAS